jgi:tRNA(Ile)-lysidine synthase
MIINVEHLNKILGSTSSAILGISGGVDSMCLLDWFYRNRDQIKYKWRVVHINHSIAQESNVWSDHVVNECKKRDIDCSSISVDLSNRGNNLEYAARHARYEAFANQPEDTVVLAHHQNDQVETFFLKVFRGSGVKGLRGMQEVSECWYNQKQTIIRPLLNVSKAQLVHYAEQYNITYCEDPSNADTSFDRNWIRNKVWPIINDRFSIADVNITRCMSYLTESWELSKELAELDFNTCSLSENALDWNKVKAMSQLRIKNLLLHIMDMKNATGFSTHQINQWAKSLKTSDINSKTELRTKDIRIVKHGPKLYLTVM